MARAGIASRREAEALIQEGRVSVNGRIVLKPGTLVETDKNNIKVNGRLLHSAPPHVYILLNKPTGFVTSTQDPQGRSTVMDLIRKTKIRVFPVGRLDYQTEGLLLLTNDGDLAHRLLHPRYGLERVYHVKIKGVPSPETLQKLQKGIHLEPGLRVRASARVYRVLKANAWLEITLQEGRHREIRRICQAIGHPVLKLRRVQFGPLKLEGLPLGKHRYLTEREVHQVRKALKSRYSANKNPKIP